MAGAERVRHPSRGRADGACRAGCARPAGRARLAGLVVRRSGGRFEQLAGPAAFANPSEEAAGDYAGWKAARDAGNVGFPEDAYSKNGHVITMPNKVSR